MKSVPLVAVPPDVAYSTVTCWLLAADSDTSSSLIVPVAVASPSVAFAGLDNVSVRVSSSSSTESSVVATLSVFDVSFAANVSVRILK